MKKEAPSRTAQIMAFFRAMETARNEKSRIFADPYAISFLDRSLKLAVNTSGLPVIGTGIEIYLQKRIPGAFSSAVARTKYIDHLLKKAVDSGVKQVVILGAGFDTRAMRLDFLKQIQVIEIDHPNTARLKTNRLKETTGKLPANVQYYQIDFNTQSLDEMAKQRKLDFSIPTAVIWEGVTNYLSAEAISATFRFIQKFASGSYVIFTYVHTDVLDKPETFYGAKKLLQGLADIEERWTFGLKPEEVKDFLKDFGLTLLEDMGAAHYRAKYIPQRHDRGYEFYRVAFARKN